MQTSTGSGLVDAKGKLVGIIVAADADDGRRGWAYAVGVSHVDRLLRVASGKQGEGVVVLKRRRPLVGMVLDQAEEAIVVSRVIPDGPAAAAGIQLGDQVLAVDGVLIRSVTQAVLPTIYKQPGDTTTFRILREGGIRNIEVTLGGGVELSSAPLDFLAGVMQPKVEMARDAKGSIVRRERAASVREVSVPPLPDDAPPAAARPTTAEKIALLEKALDRYQAVVELQQKQLQQEQKQRAEQQQVIESLRGELDELRKAINGSPVP
jgi:hypothetical protein